MRAYIKKLQSKEEVVRKQILVGGLIVSMSIVALVWMYSLGDRFGNTSTKTAEDNQVKPFTLLGNTIKNTYTNITASVAKFSFPKKSEVPREKQVDLIPVEHSGTE